jgi:hypothetical protein
MIAGFLTVTSNISSAVSVTINGISYQTTAVGATAGSGAIKLASAINGRGTSNPLPHYQAIAGHMGATDGIGLEPIDSYATGLVIETTAAGAGIIPVARLLQGVIEISPDKLSTNTPKYIGVNISTHAMTTAVSYAFLVRRPISSPTFPGRVINLTT